MQTFQKRRHPITSRLLGALFFAALIFLASDCQAQRQRGWLGQNMKAHRIERQNSNRQAREEIREEASQQRSYKYPKNAGYVDPRDPQYQSIMLDAYPKYIGGFHSSQWYNVGVPHGDIGFRGNGIYWTPW